MRQSYLGTALSIFSVAAFVALSATVLWLRLGPHSATPAVAQSTMTVDVGDNWFCDSSFRNGVCETTIAVDDTVAWDFSGAGISHTTTECGGDCDSPVPTSQAVWDSGIIGDASTFEFTFDSPGTFLYRCRLHPSQMRGRIIVRGGGEPTDTPTSPLEPTATATDTPMPTATATPVTPGPTDTPTNTPPAPVPTSTATVPPTATSTAVSPPVPSPTSTSTPTGPVGDVNCDSTVNSIDAALVLQLDAGLVGALSCQENADANANGAVNAIDAALILQFGAGLIDTLPPA